MHNHKNTADIHYIHTSSSPDLYTDVTDTAEQVASRRVTASRLNLTFPLSNVQAPCFHFSTPLQFFLVSKNKYRKNSLVVTIHTSARNFFRKGLPTHKPSTFFTTSLHEGSACPIKHTLQPPGLTVDLLANRRYRHECGGLFLHWLLVRSLYSEDSIVHDLLSYLICPDILSLVR
jgi:hypothetical protein